MPDLVTVTALCPECRAPIRIRERRFVGSTFPCPECRLPLTLLELSETATLKRASELTVEGARTAEPQPTTKLHARPATPPSQPRAVAWRLPEWVASPLFVAWSVAGLAALGFAVLLLGPWSTPASTPSPAVAAGTITESANPAAPVTPAQTPPLEPWEPPMVTDAEPAPPVIEPPVTPPGNVVTPPPEMPAIAGEQPLDPLLADEPLMPAAPVVPAVPVVLRPDPRQVLDLKLLAVTQPRPVSRRELFGLIEDLLGRRVVWSEADLGPAVSQLDQKLTLDVRDITVAALITKLLEGTGLDYVIEAETLRLVPATPAP
jgi:hypothetical protein